MLIIFITYRLTNMPHDARFIFQIKQASMKCFNLVPRIFRLPTRGRGRTTSTTPSCGKTKYPGNKVGNVLDFLQNVRSFHLFQTSLSRFANAPLDRDQIICHYSNLTETWSSPLISILHLATAGSLLHQWLAILLFVLLSNQRQLESHPSFLRPIFV